MPTPVSSSNTLSQVGPQNRAWHAAPANRCCGGNSCRKYIDSRRRANTTQGSVMAMSCTGIGCRVSGVESCVSRHPTPDTRSLGQLPSQHLEYIADLGIGANGGGRLEAAVHQAVLAARVVAGAVVFPDGVLHQVVEA